jgi:hypothetical protein
MIPMFYLNVRPYVMKRTSILYILINIAFSKVPFRHGADIQSKVEGLEQLNQSMRDRDKLKDDAIAHLSD